MRLNLKQKVTNQWNPEIMRSLMSDIEMMVNLMAAGSFQVRDSRAAAPTTGSWKRGDIIWNSAPSSAGTIGFVCTADGTPGTWKTWGVIS